ncbi:MAG: Ig-like domain-containing protein [Candidatus Sericytochromatia bacterium]|nr:Ig-like domain-containing protein [Candidatus Sericytochromatia bacterium]
MQQSQTAQIGFCCLVFCLLGCEPRSQSPLSLSSPSPLIPTPDSMSSSPHARLNLSLEPIAAAFYELRWNTQPEAYNYRLWLDDKPFKDNLVLPREVLDLTGYALGSHTLKLESINASKQVTAVGELAFEIQASMPSPTAYPTPSSHPNAYRPVLLPTPTPRPQVSPTPVVVVLPSPYQTPACDLAYYCDFERTTFNGKVFDDNYLPLKGVTVIAKSLSSNVPFNAETVTTDGTYTFNRAPSGVQVEITASKAGFATRKRVEVLRSNKQGDPNANRFDFGTDGGAATFSAVYNALSDKPEVVMVTPARNGSGVAFNTSFVLKFSEPMVKQTVENSLMISAFNRRKITVDADNRRVAGGTDTVIGNGTIFTNFLPGNSTPIWDATAFESSWNSDATEITLRFKEGKNLPSDRDSNLVPDYNVSFHGLDINKRFIQDASGVIRNDKFFKLTDGDFEESYKFSIKSDEVKPTLTQMTPDPQSPHGGGFILHYSEPMILETLGVNIAGGMSDTPTAFIHAPAGYPGAVYSTAAKAAENYHLLVKDALGQTRFEGSWAQLGGRVEYLSRDASRKSVRLTLPPFAGTATDPDVQTRLTQLLSRGHTLSEGVVPSLFEIGERLTFRVEAGVMDPAGNTVDSARNNVGLTLNG